MTPARKTTKTAETAAAAPLRPSAPTATSRLGQVVIEWDGAMEDGSRAAATPRPIPTEAVVFRSDTAEGEGAALQGNLSMDGGVLHVSNQPYDAEFWYYIAFVDLEGNILARSDRAAVTARPLVDTDAISDVIAATDPTNLLLGYLPAERTSAPVGSATIDAFALMEGRLVVAGIEVPHANAPARERLQAWLKLFLAAVEEEHEIEVQEVAIRVRDADVRLRIAATDGSFRSVEFEG